MASLYTVMFELAEGEITTKLDQFFQKYRDRYPEELMDIVRRLNSLGKETGCTENFFKLDEGLNPDDMVCALYDVPEINLRSKLYISCNVFLQCAIHLFNQKRLSTLILKWQERKHCISDIRAFQSRAHESTGNTYSNLTHGISNTGSDLKSPFWEDGYMLFKNLQFKKACRFKIQQIFIVSFVDNTNRGCIHHELSIEIELLFLLYFII